MRYAGATQSGLETQLILKRDSGVNPRSQFEFVVPAPPTPKQQTTLGKQAPQQRSHSPAPTACLTKNASRLVARCLKKDISLVKSGRLLWFDRQNLAPRG